MAVSTAQSLSFDGRLTYSINRWSKRKLGDLLLGNMPIYVMLKEKDGVEVGGLGVQIVEPLMYPQAGGHRAQGITDNWAELEHVESNGVSSAYFTPAMYGMPVSVSTYEMKLQGSETKRVDHVESVLKRDTKMFLIKQNTDFWAAEGTAGSNGSQRNSIGGIRTYLNRGAGSQSEDPAALTEQVGTGVGTTPLTSVGGIDRATAGNGFWSTPVVTDATALNVETLNNAISLATRGTDVPDIGFIGRKGFDALVTDLQAVTNANIFDVPAVLKKFSSVTYRGVTLFFDDSVPAGSGGGTNVQMFLTRTENWKLYCDTLEPVFELRQDPKRFLKIWLASWYGQVTSGDLGRNGNCRYSNLTI